VQDHRAITPLVFKLESVTAVIGFFDSDIKRRHHDNSIVIAIGNSRSVESLKAITYHQYPHLVLDSIDSTRTKEQRVAIENSKEQAKVIHNSSVTRRLAMRFFGHSWDACLGDERSFAHEASFQALQATRRLCYTIALVLEIARIDGNRIFWACVPANIASDVIIASD
jgi:hypothetical protein